MARIRGVQTEPGFVEGSGKTRVSILAVIHRTAAAAAVLAAAAGVAGAGVVAEVAGEAEEIEIS